MGGKEVQHQEEAKVHATKSGMFEQALDPC